MSSTLQKVTAFGFVGSIRFFSVIEVRRLGWIDGSPPFLSVCFTVIWNSFMNIFTNSPSEPAAKKLEVPSPHNYRSFV